MALLIPVLMHVGGYTVIIISRSFIVISILISILTIKRVNITYNYMHSQANPRFSFYEFILHLTTGVLQSSAHHQTTNVRSHGLEGSTKSH
jgi:hypothetical protein